MEKVGIDCHIYGHWKNILVCAMSCPASHRCKQLPAWQKQGENRALMWQRVLEYVQKHPEHPYELEWSPTNTTPWEDRMKRYVCIQEEQNLILTEDEVKQHILSGKAFDHIIELGKEMEVQIRLVPSKPAKEPKGKEDENKEEGKVKATNRNKKAAQPSV